MVLLSIVLSGFLLAPAAPWLHRRFVAACAGRSILPTGFVLAALPLGITILLALLAAGAKTTAPGTEIFLETHAWAPALGVSASFRLDGLSLLMALLVSAVGAIIFIYAGGAMAGHPRLGRLYAYLLLFMGSMLGLVLADNLLLLFLFWELTSVSSYLLIGFDHARPKARAAALTALLVTTCGGLALPAAALLIGMSAGTLEMSALLDDRTFFEGHALATPIILLLILAAFTKSAQFPFHFWLPAAMEAPTPVSAYLHSATMVKAGVYLLARMTPLFGWSELWAQLLIWFGAATMLIGAWLAFRQSRMKLLLAYTTVSSLGAMVFGLGVGSVAAVEAAMAFLLAHALYKGALFMVAGAVDHETGEYDLDRLGGLCGAMPILCAAALLAGASMIGLPPFFGFVAKELLVDSAMAAAEMRRFGPLPLIAVGLGAALIVAAGGRVVLRPFFGARRETPRTPREPSLSLLLGPVLLALLGLAAVWAPGLFAAPLLRTASSAAVQAAASGDLALWHGATPAFLASMAALAGGLGLLFAHPVVTNFAALLRRLDALGPAHLYDLLFGGLLAFARFQTRALQTGSLRRYLTCTITVTILTVGITMFLRAPALDLAALLTGVRFYEFGLIGLIIVGAIFTACVRTRLAAIGGLGLVGYGVALLFVLFGAPDLALTQLSVETLTVVLLVLVFRFLPDFRAISSRAHRLRDLVIALAGGAMAAGLVLLTTTVHSDKSVSEYYARASLPDAHGANVVNVILVDFRGMDTLGEITVLAVSALGALTLLRMAPWRRERRHATKGGEAA